MPPVVKWQHLWYSEPMPKEDALRRVRRAVKAREKARQDFLTALAEAEASGASWSEIGTAGEMDRASLFKLLRRNSRPPPDGV